jgi:hypothetical protein
MKTKTHVRPLTLFALLLTASPLMAANIIVNGDFSANASSFISFPGYLAAETIRKSNPGAS